jgi:hypothetical protein
MVYDGAGEGVEVYGCFCCFESFLRMQPVSFICIACGFVIGWWWCAMRDLLDRGVVEARKRSVDVDKKTASCQKRNGNGSLGNLHLEHVLGLEENFVDLFIFVDYVLLFSW